MMTTAAVKLQKRTCPTEGILDAEGRQHSPARDLSGVIRSADH
jgi:hypothetical protein